MENKKKFAPMPYIIGISLVSIIAIVLGVLLFLQNNQATINRQALETTYMRSLQELSSYVTNISNTLEKGQYVGTANQMTQLSSNLWRDASSAKASLTSIPTAEIDLSGINKYLSQVGNYAMSLSKKLNRGETLTDDEYNTLVELKKNAQNLNQQIYTLSEKISNGEVKLEQFYKNANQNNSGGGNETSPENINDLQSQTIEMEKGLKNTPSLIYDGPFSDHILSREPELIKGKDKISQDEAKIIAIKALGVQPSNVNYTQDEKSNMPSYCFTGNNMSVAVTQNGGYIAYMLKSRQVTKQEITTETALNNAKAYLDMLGIKSMKNSYFEIKNGICTVNFAYMQDDVVCYTDLIKVGVAMDNGDILSFDARGYIMNHKTRQFSKPNISIDEAKKSLSKRLEIMAISKALIPTTGKNEILTYEFKTKSRNGDNILVYINAMNGEEEQILILLIDENGTLTV